MSDRDDVEIYGKIDQLDVDVVFTPDLETPFLPTAFDALEIGCSAENPILVNEEEDNEKSLPTTPVSERLKRPAALLKCCPFGTRIENVSDCNFRNLFQ